MVFREVAAGCSVEQEGGGVSVKSGRRDCVHSEWFIPTRRASHLVASPTLGGVLPSRLLRGISVSPASPWPPVDVVGGGRSLPRAVLSSKSFLSGANWVDILGCMQLKS